MLEIDGSYGEGGGQIVRTALAMSMITGKKIKVNNIRANRPNPGLSHQHMMAIRAAERISGAKTGGVKKGSSEILFEPEQIKGGDYKFDIGTAGSVTLLSQALIPPAVYTAKDFSFRLKGGTDVKWSPPYDHFKNVFLELLKRMGVELECSLIKRGHYPKGGGEIEIQIGSKIRNPLQNDRDISSIRGRAFVTDLPEHIGERMKKEVLKRFIERDVSISIESYTSASPGTGIVIWTEGDRILGKGVLGEKGVPAEKVGEEVAEGLKKEIEAPVDLDINAADQLIPYLAMIEENGVLTTRKKTGHLETNIWVVNQFPNMHIDLEEEDDIVKIVY